MSAGEAFSRSELLLGPEALARLAAARVAVVGLGGVGSFAAEALARSGVGSLVLVDYDRIEPSNLNRQLLALRSTIGRLKVEVMKERILDINPGCSVEAFAERFDAASAGRILAPPLGYVVDAIDMVSSKIELVLRCREACVPVISSMGAGDKLDPSRLELSDLYATTICPLARVMRKELRARGVESLAVVYSREEPRRHGGARTAPGRRSTPGSMSFVPGAAGLLIASAVVRGILAQPRRDGSDGSDEALADREPA
ncbi:MAG: tRNA threonylcarbamoyladenosine dehydratase [Treponema sp.]|nr:tRNA threonylcarbamoyladenosine dehydratase [Treponema sp.]